MKEYTMVNRKFVQKLLQSLAESGKKSEKTESLIGIFTSIEFCGKGRKGYIF